MRNRSGYARFGAIAFLLISILGLAAIAAFIFLDYAARQQKQTLAEYSPPTVLVTEPLNGASAAVGSYLPISATALGINPIVRVELWLDGELRETQGDDLEEHSPFYAHFGLLMPSEGAHMLLVRAVDANGIIGQSRPISLVGEPALTEAYLTVAAQKGQTLEDIAAANATDTDTLKNLNPGIGNQPPTGTQIKVPAPKNPAPAGGAPPPPPITQGSQAVETANIPSLQVAAGQSSSLGQSLKFLFTPLVAKTGPPLAPTGLQVEVKFNCEIIMRWNDISINEDRYEVFMESVPPYDDKLSLKWAPAPVLIASLMPLPSPPIGPVGYKFQPKTGGALSLWVEAVNTYGRQKSNVVWVYVVYASACPTTMANKLDVRWNDITVKTSTDGVYCYIEFEKQKSLRFPVGEGTFILLDGGKSTSDWGIPTGLALPVPADGVLDLEGECMGKTAGQVGGIGWFKTAFPQNTWNGDRQVIKSDAGTYEIGISIKWGEAAGASYVGTDPTIPAPYDLGEESLMAGFHPDRPWTWPEASCHPRCVRLRWKWDGDPNTIEGFVIFSRDAPIANVSATTREKIVLLDGCGTQVHWQVAAYNKYMMSMLSNAIYYDQPVCQWYVRVSFDSLDLTRADDQGKQQCDGFETYFTLVVNDETRSFYSEDDPKSINCPGASIAGLTSGYKQLFGPEPNVLTVQIPPASGEQFINTTIRALFYDDDDWPNNDDLVVNINEYVNLPLPQSGERWIPQGGGSLYCWNNYEKKFSRDDADGSFKYTYAIYPNPCYETPPPEGF